MIKKTLIKLRRTFGRMFYPQYLSIGVLWSRIKVILNSFGSSGEWLSLGDLMAKKQSDTLFILGTGASVNRYTADQWEDIKHADSMGLNDWIFHDFVPTFLMAEILHDYEYFPQKYYHDLELITPRYLDHGTVMIYKDGARGKKNLDKLPASVIPHFKALYNPTLPILQIDQIGIAVKKMMVILKRHNHQRKLMIFRKRATLFSAIELAWLMGYQKIVLCGIDLNSTAYFFDEDRAYYEAKGFLLPQYTQHVGTHKTEMAKISEVTASELVKGLNEHMLKVSGVSLTVGSRTSALAVFLPYHWEDSAS